MVIGNSTIRGVERNMGTHSGLSNEPSMSKMGQLLTTREFMNLAWMVS